MNAHAALPTARTVDRPISNPIVWTSQILGSEPAPFNALAKSVARQNGIIPFAAPLIRVALCCSTCLDRPILIGIFGSACLGRLGLVEQP
ncbi:MAG: hypothetical protein ACI9W2_002295 [Gammaproteobacteria bacterium]|jgi:hypothetical protein